MSEVLPRSVVVLGLLALHPEGLVLRQLLELQGDVSKRAMHGVASTLVNQKCAGRVQYFKRVKWEVSNQGGLYRITPAGCLWLARQLLQRGLPLPQVWGGHDVQEELEELAAALASPPPARPEPEPEPEPLEVGAEGEPVIVTGAMRGEAPVVRRTVARAGQVVVQGPVWAFGLGGGHV